MEFALIGKLKLSRQEIEGTIKKMGGKVVTKIHDKMAAVISNEEEIQKMGPKMILAEKFNIQIVSEDYLESIETNDPRMCIITRCLSEWGGNVSKLFISYKPCIIFSYFSNFSAFSHFLA